jgi:ComEC/Rec2-related protein
VALFYAAGLLAGHFIPLALPWLWGAVIALFLGALIFPRWRGGMLVPLLVFTGWTNLASRSAILSPIDIRGVAGDQPELVTVRGILATSAELRSYERDGQILWRSVAKVRVSEVERKGLWQPVFGVVAASTRGRVGGEFQRGLPVELSGILAVPRVADAPGLFDYKRFLEGLGIYRTLACEGTNDWVLIGSAPGPSRTARFESWARRTLAAGLPVVDEPLELLWAMALGWKTALTDEVSEPFMRSGTLHVFAISGLHVALISGILVSLLRVARVPRGLCGLLIVPALWFYTAATGWQPSAIRSTIMMSIILAGWSLRRPPDLLNSLAAAGLVILAWEPRQLMQAGFQLSFLVVLGIALLTPVFETLRTRLLETDPFLPPELRPAWRRHLDPALRYISTSMATSLAAWIGSLPLIAHYFHLVTPVSLVSNLMIVPLSGVALMSCLGSLLCGSLAPGISEIFNHSSWFLMLLMIRLSEWAASLPSAFYFVRAPTALQFCFYYLLVGFLILRGRVSSRWRVGLGLVTAIVAVACGVEWFKANQAFTLTVLPVAGGTLLVDAPGSQEDFLIDPGSPSSAESLTIPFLHGQGMNRLRNILVTHGDQQHVGGTETVQDELGCVNLTISPLRFRSPGYRKLKESSRSAGFIPLEVARGEDLFDWHVLHPEATDRVSAADDGAIVLRTERAGIRILLLSDLGEAGQRLMIEREADLGADIVVAGIPAHGEPLSEELLNRINPQAIIVHCSDYPSGARAKPALRTRLARRQADVIYTSDAGAATVRIRNGEWSISTMNGQTTRGRSAL